MPAVAHYLEREIDRVAHVLESGDAAGPKLRALHNPGVELDHAVGVETSADAGVEEGLVLHQADGCHRRGERAATDLSPACVPGSLDGSLPEIAFVFGNGSGASVNDQRRTGARKPVGQASFRGARASGARRSGGRTERPRGDRQSPARGLASRQTFCLRMPGGRRRHAFRVRAAAIHRSKRSPLPLESTLK